MPIRPESVKRRTVWINDEDWAAIVERGQAEGKNVSVFLRERALASNGRHDFGVIEEHHVTTDAQLAAVGGRRSSGFGSPRPAPKGK